MQFIFVFVFLTPALAIKRKLKMVIFPVCCTFMHLLCIMAEWQGCCGQQLQTTRAPLNWQLAVSNLWPRTTTGCHVSRRWALQTYIYIYNIYSNNNNNSNADEQRALSEHLIWLDCLTSVHLHDLLFMPHVDLSHWRASVAIVAPSLTTHLSMMVLLLLLLL